MRPLAFFAFMAASLLLLGFGCRAKTSAPLNLPIVPPEENGAMAPPDEGAGAGASVGVSASVPFKDK